MTDELDLLRAEIAVLREDLTAANTNLREAWQALRRLPEEVEMRSGGMTNPERHPPTFAAEAEQIARGIIAIYERALPIEQAHGPIPIKEKPRR
jgi:hypothetical protein